MPLSALTGQTKRAYLFWLVATLAFAAYYGVLAVHQAFESPYVIQDDARQHIFWMQRYVDASLFPDDLIADYFQGVAPLGYRLLYKTATLVGLQPAFLGKILPPILAFITIFYCYQVSLTLFAIPFAAFISSVSFNQSLWHSSELASATPRAFLYPLFLAFLYYLLLNRNRVCLAVIALEALFYPHVALISLGILTVRLVRWRDRKLSFSKKSADYWSLGASLLLAGGIILFTRSSFDFGEVVTRSEALRMPEFQADGRSAFFTPGLQFWLYGRSGILHDRCFTPATLVAGALLPVLLWLPANQSYKRVVSSKVGLLLQVLLVSFGLYALSHLLLFELHLPNRYTSHTLRVVIALASGMGWLILLDNFLRVGRAISSFLSTKISSVRFAKFTSFAAQGASICVLALFLGGVALYPTLFFEQFPKVSYDNLSPGKPIYDYLLGQPKDAKIASLSNEASNIPTFAARTVLVSPEHALPYHKGYYSQIQQRISDLISAQYTTEPEVLLQTVERYGIDYWLVDKNAFQTAYVAENKWLMQFQPAAAEAVQTLEAGEQTILERSLSACNVIETENWLLLERSCIQQFVNAF
ncbi:hypothetical protein PN498_03400 [Oscillatoria sp. CS-180]|uniref:hypothetical protein n=1 Tax=Oscillatoria sp. CS-180 TaxID=3021720 RepID=UPI00232B0D39|nr:hypothetical protein [Oscillatoria sp. CS-180]MDB9525022.1 hypothetical protein [Oscillatoria sp. CS-180]